MKTFDQILKEVNARERQLLSEVQFYQYSALVQVRYTDNPRLYMGAEKLAEILRAVPGITRVSTASLDREHRVAVFNVRAISQKSAKDCFVAFKRNCLKQFRRSIVDIRIATNTIETKNFID